MPIGLSIASKSTTARERGAIGSVSRIAFRGFSLIYKLMMSKRNAMRMQE